MVTERLHPAAHVLFAHGLSCLPEVHATSVQRHLEACRRCNHHMGLITAEIAALCFALQPVPVPTLIKESLLHSMAEIHRLYDFAEPVSRTLKISIKEAHSLLSTLDSGAAWRQLHKFWVSDLGAARGEPALFARVPGGVRLRPSLLSASPADGGAEVVMREVLIVQGCGRDSQGQLWRPGDLRRGVRIDSLLAHPGPDLIALIIRARPQSASQHHDRPKAAQEEVHHAERGTAQVTF